MNRFKAALSGVFRRGSGDLLFYANLCLFFLMCYYVYWDWFKSVKARPNVVEFFIYAAMILAAIVVVRKLLRGIAAPLWILLLAEAGLLLNFTGGLVSVDSRRVFDTWYLWFRYDNYVHFYNSMVGCLFLARFRWPVAGDSRLARGAALFFVTMGFGAVVEIMEYAIYCNVTHNGVGNYGNNLQDIYYNGLGALAAIAAVNLWPARGKPDVGGGRTC